MKTIIVIVKWKAYNEQAFFFLNTCAYVNDLLIYEEYSTNMSEFYPNN